MTVVMGDLAAAAQEAAAESGEDWWHGEFAAGDWGGVREHGGAVFVDFTADNFWNTTGGQQTGHAFFSLLEFGVELDMEKTTGWWRGGSFKASGNFTEYTRGLTPDLVGDLNGVSNIEAPSGVRLYELWLAQTFFENQLTLQLGNMVADADFVYNETAGTLINAGFGWSQFIAANTGSTVPAYPFAALGARVAWGPTEQIQFQSAIYDGNSLDNATDNNSDGLNFNLDSGWFFIGEIDWNLNQGTSDSGLPGTYQIGGFYHSENADDLYGDAGGNPWIVTGEDPVAHRGVYGLYIGGDQQVYCELGDDGEGQGMNVFLRVAGLPKNRSAVDLVVDAGIAYTGLLPGRDTDVTSFGVIYDRVSSEVARTEEADRDINGAQIGSLSDYEMVLEFTYQAWINRWCYVQPDLQYILHPGGSATVDNAFVVGIRVGLSF